MLRQLHITSGFCIICLTVVVERAYTLQLAKYKQLFNLDSTDTSHF